MLSFTFKKKKSPAGLFLREAEGLWEQLHLPQHGESLSQDAPAPHSLAPLAPIGMLPAASPCSLSRGRGHSLQGTALDRADQSWDSRANKEKIKNKTRDRQKQKYKGKPYVWLFFPPAPGTCLQGQTALGSINP